MRDARQESPIDSLVLGADRLLRTLAGRHVAARTSPGGKGPEPSLSASERAHAAGLMRVNHAGEVCAQALYEGQALVARDDGVRAGLLQAAQEEEDHLAWCSQRLDELGSRPSVLNPLWYGMSYAIGAATGLLGDRVSLGFVAATEEQVCAHLERHLDSLPAADARSRAVVEQMHQDEARHGSHALAAGGAHFPMALKSLMTLVSRAMTETSYRL
jgi:ubiquinone biosynthesis monooxygenase Coq7